MDRIDISPSILIGAWVRAELTVAKLMRLVDLRQDVRVERFELDNINGLLFSLHGYFGVSGSGNVALDHLGKAIGEFLRARMVDQPVELLDEDKTDGAINHQGAGWAEVDKLAEKE
jgi:hypothetical protein